MKNNWTSEEITFLTKNYPLYGKKYCATKLNREGSSVYKKANRLKLKVNLEVKLFNNKLAQEKYQNERMSDDFNVNIDQFIDIKKPEVAYILGFLWADGYVIRNEIRLEILKDDLDAIKPILDSIGKWTYSYRDRDGCRTSGRATTSNKKLKEVLVKNDYDKKSYMSADKILSIIPMELKHYFFRGLIDGDGCIYSNKNKKTISISGSHKQNWFFINNLCNELNISSYTYRYIRLTGSYSTIEINGNNAITLGEYIYKDYLFGLKRKHDKFIKMKKHTI
jgi:hypothetical protein